MNSDLLRTEMLTKEQLVTIREELPLDGINTLQEETGISRATIYRCLRGESVRRPYAKRIIKAALDIIEKNDASPDFIKNKYASVLSGQIGQMKTA